MGRKKKSTSQGGKKTDEDSPKPGKTAVEEHEAIGPINSASSLKSKRVKSGANLPFQPELRQRNGLTQGEWAFIKQRS